MSRFYGKLCPVCRSPFGGNDDIVVCPDCGTPHHRACYIRTGKCAVSQYHESGFEWNGRLPDEQAEPTQKEPQETQHHSVYGEPSSEASHDTFASENTDPHHAEYPGGTNMQSSEQNTERELPPFDMPFSDDNSEPHTNPYVEAYKQMQKMTSDETRGEDGVSAKELSRFVGTSVFHYAQAFSAFRVGIPQYGGTKKVKMSMNFWAGILAPIHQIYRRMDGLGILVLLIQGILEIPGLMLYRYNTIMAQSTVATLENLALISSILSIVLMLSLSLFGDYLYYKFCVRRIKQIRAEFDDGKADGYYNALTEHGAPSGLRAVIGILATLFVSQLVAVLPFQNFFS